MLMKPSCFIFLLWWFCV